MSERRLKTVESTSKHTKPDFSRSSVVPPVERAASVVFAAMEEAIHSAKSYSFIVQVEKGFPISVVEMFRNEGFAPGEIHDLIVPARTLKHRKAKKQDLSPEETDRAVRLAKITELAYKTFGNKDKAFRWLRQTNERLNGRTPLDVLRTEVGGELVEQMLYQIDEGIYV